MPVQWRAGADQFAADLAELPRLAEAAAILGLSRTNTWVMPETSRLPEAPGDRERHREETVRLHVERIGAIARVLDRFDIQLGLEVIGVQSSRTGRGLPFIARLADLDPVLGPIRAESPNVGIVLDGWHLYAAAESVEAGFAWGVPRVIVVHVADLPSSAPSDRLAMNDSDRGLPGENGAIDSKAFLQRLHDAGYEGSVTAEPMPGCRTLQGLSPGLVAERVASAIRSVWPRQTSPL